MNPRTPKVMRPVGLAALLVAGLALVIWTGSDAPGSNHSPLVAVVSSDSTLTGIDRERLLSDLAILAHDSMEGRRTGTVGIERARDFLLERYTEIGLSPLGDEFGHAFRFRTSGTSDEIEGVNLLGVVEGTETPELFVVVSAHYDHLGIRGGEIYNGADDNASGTSTLLAIADYFMHHPPAHSILLAAFDAEELGLRGARSFVARAPIPLDSILVNINLDMVSRSEAGELYVAGTHHYPFLTPLVEEVGSRSGITLLRGHDTPNLPPGDDWTMSSDHAAFHERGIPFLYFGVEDHPGYHHPSDTFENITPEFYGEAVETILEAVKAVDLAGRTLLEQGERGP
jgi:hypothetical protein